MSSSEAAWADLAAYLRSQRKLARLSLRHLAQLTQVSDSYLSQVERGLYQPSPEVLRSIAKALGIPVTGLYERLGWLDVADETVGLEARGPVSPTSVEDAVGADDRLSPAKKAALLAVYRVLVDEPPGA